MLIESAASGRRPNSEDLNMHGYTVVIRVLALVVALLSQACSSGPAMNIAEDDATAVVTSLHCDRGWDDCYLQARRLCGDAGFEEVDRHANEDVVADGRFEQMDSSARIYRGDAHVQVSGRTLTVRCN